MGSAVAAAQSRRAGRAGRAQVNIEWFIDDVQRRTDLTFHQRMLIVVEYLRDTVVRNISVPVVKVVVGNRTRVTERSKPGEFPRADTTQLYKSIFGDVVQTDKGFEGYVGTPIDYGMILETRMNREFLGRTLREEIRNIERILGARMVA
jgi:hypothetical protein